MNTYTYNDSRGIGLALQEAQKGVGLTRPNPPVGAVVVKAGRIIGRGAHLKAGMPHAEPIALKEAGTHAKGATLYVTLEPCSTTGRTPPCTEAVIAAGIKRVVVGCTDPNPKHAGQGIDILKKAGIETTVLNDCRCRELLAPFAKWVTKGRPFVTLKLGMTLDGKIADRLGRSKWITGADSRKQVQALRRLADAVMVGADTVIRDNPSLQPRPAYGRKPFRVVVDSTGRTPPSAKVYTDRYALQTIVAVTKACSDAKIKKYESTGGQVIVLSASRKRISIPALMKQLAALGMMHVLCEGGGALAEGLVRAECVDEFVFFLAPRIMGGTESTGAIAGKGWLLDKMPQLEWIETEQCGNDLKVRARRMKN